MLGRTQRQKFDCLYRTKRYCHPCTCFFITLQNHTFISYYPFLFQHNPRGSVTQKFDRKFKRDRRRWTFADADKNESLNKTEFKEFLFPTNPLIWVAETHEDLDSDLDQVVSKPEFLAIFSKEEQPRVAKYFTDLLDEDSNGSLDLEEISGKHKHSSATFNRQFTK